MYRPAPHRQQPVRHRYGPSTPLDPDDLHLRGGIPAEFLRDREFLDIYLPILRADLELVRSYGDPTEEPLDLVLRAFGGAEDVTPLATMRDWRNVDKSGAEAHVYRGGHFYLCDALAAVTGHIAGPWH